MLDVRLCVWCDWLPTLNQLTIIVVEQSLQLVDKKDVQSTALSGGMKRKLNCGMALVGGSKVWRTVWIGPQSHECHVFLGHVGVGCDSG